MNDYKDLIEKLKENASDNCCDYCSELYERAADTIEHLVKERDEAVDWLPHQCNLCKHCHPADGIHCAKGGCADWKRRENWEWRGITDDKS